MVERVPHSSEGFASTRRKIPISPRVESVNEAAEFADDSWQREGSMRCPRLEAQGAALPDFMRGTLAAVMVAVRRQQRGGPRECPPHDPGAGESFVNHPLTFVVSKMTTQA